MGVRRHVKAFNGTQRPITQWEVFHLDESICDSTDDNTEGARMLSGLDQLLGKKVSRARMNATSGNFKLDFPGELCLAVYCDDLDNQDRCYGFSMAGKHLGTAMCKALPQAPA